MNLHSIAKSIFYRMGYSIKKLRVGRRTKGAAKGWPGPEAEELLSLLHAVDPYEGFDYQAYSPDDSGWGSDSAVFETLICQTRDLRLIVEVGTWKGGSALHMARILEAQGIDAKVLCIDTWLGALEFWDDHNDESRYGSLGLKNGYPTVYYQFLANVCHQGHQQRIIPFPQTSSNAAKWLRIHDVRADLIYVDGSHEEDDVYQDIVDYAEVLERGGILFGDDYAWDGVRLAVNRFAKETGRRVELMQDKWILHFQGHANPKP